MLWTVTDEARERSAHAAAEPDTFSVACPAIIVSTSKGVSFDMSASRQQSALLHCACPAPIDIYIYTFSPMEGQWAVSLYKGNSLSRAATATCLHSIRDIRFWYRLLGLFMCPVRRCRSTKRKQWPTIWQLTVDGHTDTHAHRHSHTYTNRTRVLRLACLATWHAPDSVPRWRLKACCTVFSWHRMTITAQPGAQRKQTNLVTTLELAATWDLKATADSNSDSDHTENQKPNQLIWAQWVLLTGDGTKNTICYELHI